MESPLPNLAVKARHQFQATAPNPEACFQLIEQKRPYGLEIGFKLRDGSIISLPYLLLGSKQLLRNSLIRLTVNDAKINCIEIKGRNLQTLYQYICLHRIDHIREANNPNLTIQSKESFVAKIEIHPPSS